LPTLGYLIKKGNTTVYEWRTGAQPKQIEKSKDIAYNFGDDQDQNGTENQKEEDKIDFGDFETDNIVLDTENQGVEIDWGDLGNGVDMEIGQVENLDENVIDYDLDELKNQISVEGSGVYIPSDGIAKGNDAFLLLEWHETRNLFINDLIKLETFLKHKLNEMRLESDNLLLATILQDAPKSIQSVSEKDVQKWSAECKQLFDLIRVNKKYEKLFKINDSVSYLKRLYDQFMLKKKSIDRCVRQQNDQRLRQQELALEENDLNEKLKLIISKTKDLQKYVCADLSKKYNGARINLMGEINLL
jgi:hypothetical protein